MKKIASILIVSMLLFSMILMAPLIRADGVNGTTLYASVTATAHWTRTFAWTIDKSVTPTTWNLFTGDSGASQYTITVTKGTGTDAYYIDGVITVQNGGAVDTENLVINVELRDGIPPPNDLIATFPVDVSANPVISAGQTCTYAYSVTIPSYDIELGGTYKIIAAITITNHSKYLGTPYGPRPETTTILPTSPTLINDEIDVSDTNGGSWHFTGSGSVSYAETFTSAGTYTNTATIEQTGQSSSATVTVNVYNLDVSKDAQTYFTRTYTWTIVKSADQTYLELKTGDTADVHYTITVDATYTDSDWGVKQINGIVIHNPAPMDATINSITDVVSPDIAADVDLTGITFPYSLAAGATLTLNYKTNLPDATSRINTATVTLQNYDYRSDGSATAAGTTDFTGTAGVDFSTAIITEVDESITVSDTYAGPLGTVTYGDAPKTFTYTRTIGPYTVPGPYTVVNTASFITSDTKTTDKSSWEVDVSVIGAATISGLKFYDSNADGTQQTTETGISGWTIQLLQLQPDGTYAVVQTVLTDIVGGYIFENVGPGTYKVQEILPPAPPVWMATTPMISDPITVPSSGGAFAGPVFGNVKLTSGTGGLTIGFWTNKNGQALLTLADATALNGLGLYKYGNVPPFSTTNLATFKSQIKTYLLSATATDMKFMLSAQLIATELNVRHGFLSGTTIVYTDPYDGFMTINQILSGATSALTSGTRAQQEFYKNLLDGINNNHFPFVV